MKHFLKKAADTHHVELQLDEWDILRGEHQDLTQEEAWKTVKDKLLKGFYDFVIVAPPCNTFSRARHNKRHLGPKPLRSWDYLKGFPWLKATDQAKVTTANLLVERALEACELAHQTGAIFLVEHPEQLGLASQLVPASIWDWPEFKQLQVNTGLAQAAIFQCSFGATTSKPTRLATNATQEMENSALGSFLGPHVLDAEGRYLGPLPSTCPHGAHQRKLIGKSEDGSWKTSPAAAYPPGLCQQIADLIVRYLLKHPRKGGKSSLVQEESKKKDHQLGEHKQVETGAKKDELPNEPPLAEEEEGEPFHGHMVQAAVDNVGLPVVCWWQNHPKSFSDGGGLCSPGRWRPRDRGAGIADVERKEWICKLALLLRTFVVRNLADAKRATFQLATGHMKEPPFPEGEIQELRSKWFELLGGGASLSEITPHQPFYLFALEATLRKMGDEDWRVITQQEGDNYVTGRRVGVGGTLQPTPLVFRARKKGRKYDDSIFQAEADNYASAVEAKELIGQQFAEEEQLGWMYPLTEAEARRRFGDRLRIASLAAIPKDEKSVRVLFDGTHSVQVNNEIEIVDRLEFPTPSELARVMEVANEESWGVVISIAADIMKAHRRFLHDERDQGYLCCRADSESKVVWVNRVGTFGVACAALHFGRLAGAIFRMVIRLLQQQPCFQLLFADDLKWVVGGPTKYVDLWTMIVGWLLVGTPFSWRKFRGGLALDYVGYWTDYGKFRLGLSEKRAQWTIKAIDALEQSNFVMTGRGFSELLGRLGFASQAVLWIRPMLGALYAWDSVLSPFMAARIPGLAAATLLLIRDRFKRGDFMASCWSPRRSSQEVFRTDAKCETGKIVLGGWELLSGNQMEAEWFSFEVTAQEAPWLYYRGAEVQRMSTAAEMLASYAALHAFGYLSCAMEHRRENMVSLVSVGTDNLANEQLAKKRLTTKLPLGVLMLQMHTKLWDNGLWLDVKWRPREQNTEADDLTNGKFTGFSKARRVSMSYASMDLKVLEQLQAGIVAFEETTSELRGKAVKTRGLTKRQKVESKTNW